MNDTIRHDLKNHLTVILGFADVLLDERPMTENRRADLEEIRRAATAALTILDDLSRRAHADSTRSDRDR